jgi:hypothetical protein
MGGCQEEQEEFEIFSIFKDYLYHLFFSSTQNVNAVMTTALQRMNS